MPRNFGKGLDFLGVCAKTGLVERVGGAPMSGGIEISRTSTPGRYTATGQFGMSGVWKMTVQWDGPAGRGSVPFEGNVQ